MYTYKIWTKSCSLIRVHSWYWHFFYLTLTETCYSSSSISSSGIQDLVIDKHIFSIFLQSLKNCLSVIFICDTVSSFVCSILVVMVYHSDFQSRKGVCCFSCFSLAKKILMVSASRFALGWTHFFPPEREVFFLQKKRDALRLNGMLRIRYA